MTIDQIKYFLAIIESGSFSIAAEEMFLSQSALSKQLKGLEDEVGCPLIHRMGKGISLTGAGEVFLPYAISTLNQYDKMLKQISYFHQGSGAKTAIGVVPFVHEYGLSRGLADYQVKSQSAIEITERNQSGILHLLNTGKIELAFVRTDRLDSDTYHIIPLGQDELVLVCHHGYLKPDTIPVNLASFQNHPFVIMNSESSIHTLMIEQLKKYQIEPDIRFQCTRHLHLLELIDCGIGLTLMPAKLFNQTLFPDLRAYPISDGIRTSVGIVWKKEKMLSRQALALCEFFKSWN